MLCSFGWKYTPSCQFSGNTLLKLTQFNRALQYILPSRSYNAQFHSYIAALLYWATLCFSKVHQWTGSLWYDGNCTCTPCFRNASFAMHDKPSEQLFPAHCPLLSPTPCCFTWFHNTAHSPCGAYPSSRCRSSRPGEESTSYNGTEDRLGPLSTSRSCVSCRPKEKRRVIHYSFVNNQPEPACRKRSADAHLLSEEKECPAALIRACSNQWLWSLESSSMNHVMIGLRRGRGFISAVLNLMYRCASESIFKWVVNTMAALELIRKIKLSARDGLNKANECVCVSVCICVRMVCLFVLVVISTKPCPIWLKESYPCILILAA